MIGRGSCCDRGDVVADCNMIDAGRDIGPDAPYGLSETIKRWQAMIDEALR